MNQYRKYKDQFAQCLDQNRLTIDADLVEIMDHTAHRQVRLERIQFDVDMKEHTNFRLGGRADVMVFPETQEELVALVRFCRNEGIPVFVMGNGSNILVMDEGIEGVVLKLELMRQLDLDDNVMKVGPGTLLKVLSDVALAHSLRGLEFCCGIPGSMGGAIFMNASAYSGSFESCLQSLKVLTPDGRIQELSREELDLSYRSSVLRKKNLIALEATLVLEKGDSQEISHLVAENTRKRTTSQPLESPSAGSTFKRPDRREGEDQQYASALIDATGLKGFVYKGAAVSPKHAGFLIKNQEDCTTKDVIELIALIQERVEEATGYHLEPEVLLVGRDSF
ncbi:UDP-N-acetylenolpyruvoylglucosamine reductase [Clostridiaceae bacterium JG1575]|nr:UDP-N-acetylenolpyruvoylglucosamine reductase [Clostridiaceae bacterium JG1575]